MWDYIFVLLGSCLAQVFFVNEALQDKLLLFYKRFHPNVNMSVFFKVEYSILPLIGALIAYEVHSPDTLLTQIAAGFSWSATFEAFLKKK